MCLQTPYSLYSFAFLPSTGLIPRGETIFHFPLIMFLALNSCSENILKQFQDLSLPNFFIASSKIFKDFFACKLILAANRQLYPGNIQRPFEQQSTAATSISNQQQQSTAATSSSNQQQQPAAAINSSNQQQQSTAATSTSNQQQQLAATTSFHPTSSTYTIHDDFR